MFESDLGDLLRSFALQKKDKNFLPKTIKTTMKAVAITIITMTRGILAAPSVLNGYRTALSGKEDFKRNIRMLSRNLLYASKLRCVIVTGR